jgi:cell division protein FtsI/penicillin-binding protein 2
MADLNESRTDLPRSGARFMALGVAAAVVFAALGGRLFQLQVVEGGRYAARARRRVPSRWRSGLRVG